MRKRHIDGSLTADQLREWLHYDPWTGFFTWRDRPGKPVHYRRIPGTRAGFVTNDRGCIKIGLDGPAYYANRLAWLYMTGEWPDVEVDHIDTNPTNNAWWNLRLATHRQNSHNMSAHKTIQDELPRMKGARFHRTTGRWQASIVVNGKSIYLGLYKTQQLAHEAYCRAARDYFGDFARTG